MNFNWTGRTESVESDRIEKLYCKVFFLQYYFILTLICKVIIKWLKYTVTGKFRNKRTKNSNKSFKLIQTARCSSSNAPNDGSCTGRNDANANGRRNARSNAWSAARSSRCSSDATTSTTKHECTVGSVWSTLNTQHKHLVHVENWLSTPSI